MKKNLSRILNTVNNDGVFICINVVSKLDYINTSTHIRNKIYRWFLKIRSEDDILDMLLNTKSTCTYTKFFAGYQQRFKVDKFYDMLEQKLNKIDFSNDIDYIFDSITWCRYYYETHYHIYFYIWQDIYVRDIIDIWKDIQIRSNRNGKD